MFASLKVWARGLKRRTLTVYFAARDRRMPAIPRVLAFSVAAYALCPIDLIPDFIPVFGYVDDLLLVPLGIALVMRLAPAEILESAAAQARQAMRRPVSYGAAALMIALWLIAASVAVSCLWGT